MHQKTPVNPQILIKSPWLVLSGILIGHHFQFCLIIGLVMLKNKTNLLKIV